MESRVERKSILSGIDTIINILQDIKKSGDADKYRMVAEITPFYMEDHTKGPLIMKSKIGSKLKIIITEGETANITRSYINENIYRDEECDAYNIGNAGCSNYL